MSEPPSAGAPLRRPRGPARQGPDDGVPSVFVADEQRDQPVDAARWQALAERTVLALGVTGEAELSLLFVDEGAIAELNGRFLGHPGPTDVLSFPIDGEHEPGGRSPDGGTAAPDRDLPTPDDLPLLLGDVVVCPAVAARNAPGHAGTYEDELALLVVHGILHLLGHDHAEAAEREAMWDLERRLLAELHGPLAADPWAAVAAEEAAALASEDGALLLTEDGGALVVDGPAAGAPADDPPSGTDRPSGTTAQEAEAIATPDEAGAVGTDAPAADHGDAPQADAGDGRQAGGPAAGLPADPNDLPDDPEGPTP